MAGIGEASAIISVVELGFSLATALNTYVCSVSAAPEDVANLSSEIEATFLHLKGLETLISRNKETKAWDDDGLELATRSIRDCDVIVKKLRKLLQKANWRGRDGENTAFVKHEIDLSKFERVLWPRLKPDLEVCKGELQRIKLNIILANNSYMIGTVSTEAEKKKYREAMTGLTRAREWNSKKLTRLRESRIPRINQDAGISSRGYSKYTMPGQTSGYPMAENNVDIELQEDFEEFLRLEEEKQLENEREFVLIQEARKRELEEEKKRKIEDKAIADYLSKVKKRQAEGKEKREELQRRLEERGGLTQQQIESILDDVHPQNREVAALVQNDISAIAEQTTPRSVPNSHEGGRLSTSSSFRKASKILRIKNFFRSSDDRSQTNTEYSPSITLTSAWRDPATKTGFARLESWYISAEEGGQSFFMMQAPLPNSWVLKALMEAESGNLKAAKRFPPVWEVLLSLSPHLVQRINNLLEERATRKPYYDWSILLIDLPKLPENKRSVSFGPLKFYLEDKAEAVSDIYVILKYEENPLGLQSRRNPLQRTRSPDSILSERPVAQPPVQPSATMAPERTQSTSRRMASIARARSTFHNPSGPPAELHDSTYSRGPRRSSEYVTSERKPPYQVPQERVPHEYPGASAYQGPGTAYPTQGLGKHFEALNPGRGEIYGYGDYHTPYEPYLGSSYYGPSSVIRPPPPPPSHFVPAQPPQPPRAGYTGTSTAIYGPLYQDYLGTNLAPYPPRVSELTMRESAYVPPQYQPLAPAGNNLFSNPLHSSSQRRGVLRIEPGINGYHAPKFTFADEEVYTRRSNAMKKSLYYDSVPESIYSDSGSLGNLGVKDKEGHFGRARRGQTRPRATTRHLNPTVRSEDEEENEVVLAEKEIADRLVAKHARAFSKVQLPVPDKGKAVEVKGDGVGEGSKTNIKNIFFDVAEGAENGTSKVNGINSRSTRVEPCLTSSSDDEREVPEMEAFTPFLS